MSSEESGMNLIDELLEKTCKNMIKTILACLDNATKGTVYRIGVVPKLQAVRITSGIRIGETDDIEWGLPSVSDYNYPGKNWEEYRDRSGHPLEAMGWCVQRQQSWTADNPAEDERSVRKQLRGELEDVYHMEPVLVRKIDLYGTCTEVLDYPVDWRGNPIWQDSEYVVAAVIKIHFLPNTLRREDRSTRVIKELSRSLGTELLSLHLHETLSRLQQEFAYQRLESCKILAHELRNTLIKFGFLFSAVNAQIGILREEWEAQLRKAFPDLEWKGPLLERLNELIRMRLPALYDSPKWVNLCTLLLAEQDELAISPLLPSHGEEWLKNKIQPKWKRLLAGVDVWDADREEVGSLLSRLGVALRIGVNPDFARNVTHLPRDLRDKWINLAYVYFTPDRLFVLEEILQLLEDPRLPVPHKYQMKKVLRYLMVLVGALPQVEERANKIMLSLRYGDALGTGADQESDFPRSCEVHPYMSEQVGISLSE
jgi:hypothetical protein